MAGLSSEVAASSYIPQQCRRAPESSHPHACLSSLERSHASGCELASHRGFFFFFLDALHISQDLNLSSPTRHWPLQWKPGGLTTRPPRQSLPVVLICIFLVANGVENPFHMLIQFNSVAQLCPTLSNTMD